MSLGTCGGSPETVSGRQPGIGQGAPERFPRLPIEREGVGEIAGVADTPEARKDSLQPTRSAFARLARFCPGRYKLTLGISLAAPFPANLGKSEQRRAGQQMVRVCIYWWTPYT